MATPLLAIAKIQKKVWDGSLPLEIRLANADCRTYDETDPYLINLPRLSYLPFLLPRLHAFFAPSLINPSTPPHELWLSFQGVPLKYHHPVGLLYDLFSGAPPANPDDDEVDAEETLPWKLELRVQEFPPELMGLDAEGKVVRDCFVNGVKEADVIRNGKGNVYMGLSKNDSDVLWEAVKTHNLQRFNTINNKLLNPPGTPLRNIPMKIYLPTAPSIINPEEGGDSTIQASIRTVQSLVAPFSGTRQPNTLGMALNQILPTVFPSRRNPVLATPVLHGAVVPMGAPVEELMRAAAFADGFLHIVVVML
ncbi:putative autophagy protein Apg5 [Aureobasidium pullulans EXF-150]|uniref:Autophagy protein 5 n=1 Tax=Aureobasidium pullulans EXF-150 TaxID=1043002 RepID=A0A074YB30_AURPU|nr:putative autophagy protein Apg5 [Aureobasidium pullulans EXF-150]KEQ84056.1 putative autophagy protein Apg5 [Aureobasidium pullulans EXF-150]